MAEKEIDKSKVKFDKPLRIVSKQDGFWRGGVRHPAGEVTHAPGAFTQLQAEQILEEPMLVARELTADEYKAHLAAEKKSDAAKQ